MIYIDVYCFYFFFFRLVWCIDFVFILELFYVNLNVYGCYVGFLQVRYVVLGVYGLVV